LMLRLGYFRIGWKAKRPRLQDGRHQSVGTGVLGDKKIFGSIVPDLPTSRRNTNGESASLGSDKPGDQNEARGELRLRVLNSLPILHQRYLFEEIRKRCSWYLRSRRVSGSEVTIEEMLSEVWKKLLSNISVQAESTGFPFHESSSDLIAPDRDGRVVWLIKEVGGPEALSHRHEDILRQRHGRSMAEVGRPMVQPEGDEVFEGSVGASEPPMEIAEVARLAWLGLNILAERRFSPHDDVSMLLHLFKETPDLFEETATGRWPINDIVIDLNIILPDPSWRVDRVENAKKRLVNWIAHLRRKNGLDQVDLEALLVRVAKESQRGSISSKSSQKPYIPN
jgi:hypothetical protein